jgi:hypothetical protein
MYSIERDSVKIWLDDVREAPDDSWTVIRTYQECSYEIMFTLDCISDISLDHDLGEEKTGYDIVKLIKELVADDYNYFPPRIFVHSDNPVGRANMWAAIRSINQMMATRYEGWSRPR